MILIKDIDISDISDGFQVLNDNDLLQQEVDRAIMEDVEPPRTLFQDQYEEAQSMVNSALLQQGRL